MIKSFFLSSIFPLGVAFLTASACSSEKPPVRTRDDIAADSALVADLALANRDSLLVDSIGYRPPESAAVDTGVAGSTKPNPAPAATRSTAREAPPPAAPRVAPSAAATVAPAPAPAPARAAASPRPPTVPRAVTASTPKRRITGNSCSSPAMADQQACLRTLLANSDQRLNGIYRALLTETRRRHGEQSVARLRTAQRAWLVNRDTECRRIGRGVEGQLWARPRAQCLGEFSARRANELADNFSRLTAH